MIQRLNTLGKSVINLANMTGRLAWSLVAGPLGRCYFCGSKRVAIEFPEGCRYWGVDLVGGDGREVKFCPDCESTLLQNARQIIARSDQRVKGVSK